MGSSTMRHDDIEARYGRYVDAWNAHDPTGVMTEFADDGTFDDPASDGTLSGEEIGAWVEEIVEAFPDVQFSVDRSTVDEEGVLFAEWTMRGTHDGPLGGLPPTHRTVEVDAVDIVTCSEDGITSVTGYFDMAEFKEQLGLAFPTIIGQFPTLLVGALEHVILPAATPSRRGLSSDQR